MRHIYILVEYDKFNVCVFCATEVEIQFEFMEYFVEESSGSVTVCVLQTSVPPVSFARPVELIFNTIDGSATGEQELLDLA